MKIEALVRFNERPKGTVWDADDEDAKKWIGEKLAKKTDKPITKTPVKPPKDTMAKDSKATTK